MILPDDEEDLFDGDEDDNDRVSDGRELADDRSDEQEHESAGPGEPERLAEDADDAEGDQERDEGNDEQERSHRVDTRTNDLNSRQRRSQNRYKQVEEERNRLREEAAAEKRRADALEARQQADQAERNRLHQEAIARQREQMLPEERNAAELQDIKAQLNYDRLMRQHELKDAQDRANFQAQASVNPLYKRHAAEVERSLAQLAAAGKWMPRDAVLKYCVGEEMLKNSQKNSKPLNPQKSRTVPKPNNSRADSSRSQGGRKPSSEKARIEKQWGDTPL
jgi:hypothetical protein